MEFIRHLQGHLQGYLHERLQGKMARLSLTALLLGVMAVGLTACGTEATPTPATGGATNGQGTGSGSTQDVKAVLNEWSVTLGANEVNAGKVKFLTTNDGQFPHNLVVLDANGNELGETPVFKKEESPKDLEVDLTAGSYKLVCTVPGHTERGMTTDLTVK